MSLPYRVVLTCWLLVFVRISCDEDNQNVSSKITYPNDFLLFSHDHYHHHHRGFPPDFQHSSEFHKDDTGYFKHEVGKADDDRSEEIPLDFIRNLNEHNVSDLLLNFIEMDIDEQTFVANRFAETQEGTILPRGGPNNRALLPKPAGCSPEITTVKLTSSNDPSVFYVPQCTKVERCGGCCSHTLLSCQPIETETLTYQIIKSQYTGGKKLKFLGKELVLVEKHIKCKCDCKIKAENCTKYQEYRPSECRCVCSNTDEEKKCYKTADKLWNPERCICECRDIINCTTGYTFDQNVCKCLPTPIKRRYVTYSLDHVAP